MHERDQPGTVNAPTIPSSTLEEHKTLPPSWNARDSPMCSVRTRAAETVLHLISFCRACALLLEVGVEEERVNKLLDDAASWRVIFATTRYHSLSHDITRSLALSCVRPPN
eukprot:6831020-Pyramimonas_sp.AAC.2